MKLNKEKVNKEILKIILFHLTALKMRKNKENIQLATVMFVEGVRYIKEKREGR